MKYLQLSLKEIEIFFDKKQIPYDIPGFYDHPNFIKEEQKNQEFLEIYAAYVYKKEYSDEYLQYAKNTILQISEIFSQALQRNNRLGACIDASNTVSRILDRFGIWNFVIKGSLTMSFPSEANIPDTSFWHIDLGNHSAAHAWLYCPPFNTLDLTVRHQPYTKNEIKFLPAFIANQVKTIGVPKISDIASPMAISYFGKVKIKDNFDKIIKFQEVIGTYEFQVDKTVFRYIPLGMGLTEEPLERFQNLKLDGLYPYDFYVENIKNKVSLK